LNLDRGNTHGYVKAGVFGAPDQVFLEMFSVANICICQWFQLFVKSVTVSLRLLRYLAYVVIVWGTSFHSPIH